MKDIPFTQSEKDTYVAAGFFTDCNEISPNSDDVNHKTLNQFFQEANSGTSEHCYEDPQGFLMISTSIPTTELPLPGTATPVNSNALDTNPFLDWTPDQILSWAEKNFKDTGLSNRNIVILDERTNDDYTCLLAAPWDFPDDHKDRLLVRSDFESSVVSLMTIEMGCGGDDVVDADGHYRREDGVLRMGVVHRAQEVELERNKLEWAQTTAP